MDIVGGKEARIKNKAQVHAHELFDKRRTLWRT